MQKNFIIDVWQGSKYAYVMLTWLAQVKLKDKWYTECFFFSMQ